MHAGDDSGVIKLWDSRQSDAVASLDAHDDFVSDMALHERESCLLSVSGDGTLAVTDLRTNKVRGFAGKMCPEKPGSLPKPTKECVRALVYVVFASAPLTVCGAVKLLL